jgi:hypothetical protein
MDANNGAVYQDGKVYQAQIIDQVVTKTNSEVPQVALVLQVKIKAKLKNDKNPGDGTEACPQLEREVRITFVEDDYDRLRMAVQNLERLGFADDDISRLHPEHPGFFSLLEKEVYVRKKTVNDTEYWNLAWPREKPKAVAIGELQAEATSLKDRIAGAKAQMKRDRATKKATPTSPTPPEVGY